MINIIVALTENNAIGRNNSLLFKLKRDLQHFKEVTSGNIVIMGRKTYESIGKPLPNRVNVVLTKDVNNIFDYNDDINIFTDLEDAIETMKNTYPEKDVFIIGGGQIYKEALDNGLVDKLYITKIKKEVPDADTFFPMIDYKNEWCITVVERFFENDIEFLIYQAVRKK